jgi:hypothetical protein
MANVTSEQKAALEALLESVHSTGGGHFGIEAGVLTDFVRNDPELSALAVQTMLKLAEENKGYGKMAAALAAAYQSVFDDDTLTVYVRNHYAALGQPVPELKLQDDAPPKPSPPGRYDVPEDDLRQCDIYPLLKIFSHNHLASGDSISRLRNLGGQLFITFPVPLSDPRHVWQVPEVRAYVRALADAMPYFPYYLATDQSLGMFEVYFGSLVDPELLKGGAFDLMSEEILETVIPALVATAQFADLIGADGEESVRALLAILMPTGADFVMDLVRQVRKELPQP